MEEKNKKKIYYLIVAIAIIILISIGSTFAYFSASISSDPNAVDFKAAEFQIQFKDDTSLIKGNIIPSIEEYVDITSKRTDSEGNFLKPIKDTETNIMQTEGTACIDDNLNEICSMYTFTIMNPMTTTDLPLYITLNVSINNFENLYYKVLDNDLNEVINTTHLVDDRYELDSEGNYKKDDNGQLIKKDNFENLKISPVVLTNINKTLPKAPDEENPSKVTYTIVMWIMETGQNQNEQDGGKVFASTLNVEASGADGKGITGVFSVGGIE